MAAAPAKTMTFMPFRVHVCGLRRSKVNRTAEIEVLTRFFQNVLGCNVEDVSLMVDNKTGRSRGFAFVDLKDAVSLKKALALDPASQIAQKLADSVSGPVTVKMSKQLAAAVRVQRWWRLRRSRASSLRASLREGSLAECDVVVEYRRGGEGHIRGRGEGEPTVELDASRRVVNVKNTFLEVSSSSPPLPGLQSRGKTWPLDHADCFEKSARPLDRAGLEQAIQQLLDYQAARLDKAQHLIEARDTPAR
jgi:hypothetical protein